MSHYWPFQHPPPPADYRSYHFTNPPPHTDPAHSNPPPPPPPRHPDYQPPHSPLYSQFPHPQHFYPLAAQHQQPPPPLAHLHPHPHIQPPPDPSQYGDPRSPLQQAFNPQPEFPPIPGAYNAYDYPPTAEIGALNLDERPSSPQYVGRRARSRASSKAGSTATRPTSRVDQTRLRGRTKQVYLQQFPGYKPPTVETAPNSPLLLPSLSSDAGSLLERDDEYLGTLPEDPLPPKNPHAPEGGSKPFKLRKRPVPLPPIVPPRAHTPFTNSSGTTSTAGSSSPPEVITLERERRQYAGTAANSSSDARERQRTSSNSDSNSNSSSGGNSNSSRNRNSNSCSYSNSSRRPADHGGFERERRQYAGSATSHRSSLNGVERERHPYPPNESASNPKLPPENPPPHQSQPYSSASYNAPSPETNPRQPQPYSSAPYIPPEMSREPQPYSNVPYVTPEMSREPQPYSNVPYVTPEMSREPQPYSSTSSAPTRRPARYAASSGISHAREVVRPGGSPHSPRVPPSPRHRPSPQPPESPSGYASSPLHTAKSSESSTTTRFDTPTPSEPSPTPSPQDSFGQSLVARPSTPQSEFLQLLPACPKRQLVSRGNWYGVPSIKGFDVCEKCYEVYVYDSAFARYFQQIKLAKGEKTFCGFNNPRVVEFIWPTTVKVNDFDIFADYARERGPMGTCAGMGSPAKEGVWYKIRGRTQGVLACEACYQDVILASPFHHHFERMEATAVSENTIPCHVAWPFVEARLLKKPSTFEEVERDINYRLTKVLACPEDKLIKVPGRRWWKPKGTALPIFICDCCYWDGIFPTAFGDEFKVVVQEQDDVWCCAMSCYQLSTVWQYATEKEDLTPWLEAANAAWSPMCEAEGSSNQIWNVFKDPALDGFDFCERCTSVFIRPLGFGSRLEQRRYDSQEVIKCDLNSANEHQREIIQKLGEAAAWREPAILQEFLTRLGPRVHYLPCPGEQPATRSQWWGCGDFIVCEECYQQRVRLASPCAGQIRKFDCDGKLVSAKCDLGTENWRYIWKRRCCEGRDFDRFMEALLLKHQLEEVKHKRLEFMDEMREKSRRGLSREGRRRMNCYLEDLEVEERDTTNMLAAATRL